MNTKWMHSALYLVPVLFLLAVIGYAVDSYSSVPFWDSWDSFMGLISRIETGDYAAIFEVHSGHRIVFSKLLFLADYYIFKSHFAALIATNVLLMTLSFSMFAWLSYKCLGRVDAFFLAILSVLIFLLSQAENIRWEFQSQFWLAQIIPFAVFILFASSLDEKIRIQHVGKFGAAVLLAITANFTMGNGFFAILILLAMLFIIKSNLLMKCSVALLAAASITLVLAGAGSADINPGGGAFDLVKCSKYILVYLGSPFYHIIQFYGIGNSRLSIPFGAIFIALCVLYGWHMFKTRKIPNRYALAALCMIAYVALSASLAAFAKYQFGIGQATSERYTTPVLMGWAALLLLYWPLFEKRVPIALKTFSIVCVLVFLPYQHGVAQKKVDAFYYQIPFSGDVLMTALFLGVDDPINMQRLHPSPERIREVVAARASDAGFFTHSERYLEMQQAFSMHHDVSVQTAPQCLLHIDDPRTLESTEYTHLQGWLKYENYDGHRRFVVVYDNLVQKIGYVVLGQPRPDVARHFHDQETNVGFGGYFPRQLLSTGGMIYFYNPQSGYLCSHEMPPMES